MTGLDLDLSGSYSSAMFDPAKAEQIVSQIWEGKSMRQATAEVGVKNPTFMLWVNENEHLAEQYARAIATRAEIHAQRIEDVIDKVESGELKPDQGRVMADQLKWIASKLNPRRYGDKVMSEVDMTLRISIDDPTRNARATAKLIK
jgi:polyhydroxyalkanoate synthesis regulator phasin